MYPSTKELVKICWSVLVVCTFASPSSQTAAAVHGRADQTAIVNFSEIASASEITLFPTGLIGGHSRNPLRSIGAPVTARDNNDSPLERQAIKAQAVSPPLTTNFFSADQTIFVPPDTMGAAGPRHLMGTFNGVVVIQDRNGVQISRTTLGAFWSGVGVSDLDAFDPKVLYDAADNRWIVVTMAFAESTSSSVLLAVSTSDDPTGNWILRRYDADPSNLLWADYPSMGYNRNWIGVSVNMFGVADNSFDHAEIYAFDKRDLYSGGAGKFTLLPTPDGFTPVPAVTLDTTVDVLYVVENVGPQNLRISTIGGPVGQEVLNTGTATATGPRTWDSSGIFVPQRGSGSIIDGGDGRMQNVVYRFGSLWCAHAIFLPALNPTHAAVQWWQIDPTGNVVQNGLIEDSSGQFHYSYPSIAVNRNGDVMVGHAGFSSSTYGSGYYSFRSKDDPIGVLRDPVLLKAGEAAYDQFRWGDYSATVVDPLDDVSFWTIQQYTKVGGDWGTWWGYMSLDSTPDGVMSVSFDPASGTRLRGGVVTNFTVRVSDAGPVTDATVVGSNPNLGAILFNNQGTSGDAVAGDDIYTAVLTLPTLSGAFPIHFDISAPGKTNISTNISYAIFPTPANDNFTNATKIAAGGASGPNLIVTANAFATLQQGEPSHGGVANLDSSIWYNWSPVASGRWLLDTSGSAPDTVVAIYTGGAIDRLTEVASNDDPTTNRQAWVSFQAMAGLTYRLVVAGKKPSAEGAIRLRLEMNGQPDLTPPLVSVTSPPSGLVTAADHIEFRGAAQDPEPNSSGIIAVFVINLAKDPPIPADVIGKTNWTGSVRLFEGDNEIQVFSVDGAGNHSASRFIHITYKPVDLPNDLFAKAIRLTGTVGTATGISTNASKEFGEPNHGGNVGGKSLWWFWVAPSSGLLQVNTMGSSGDTLTNVLDTLLGIYEGDRVNTLANVGQNDDASDVEKTSELTIPVVAGHIYNIAVDGFAGSSGTIVLHYTFQPSALVSVIASAGSGGTVSPLGTNLFPINSTVSLVATPEKYFDFDRFVSPSGTFFQNPLSVPVVAPLNFQALFVPHQFVQDFDNTLTPNGSWVNNGWVLDTAADHHVQGRAAASSGVTGNSSSKSLILNTTVRSGMGSFEYRVSSEAIWDKLEFLTNGVLAASWSGEVPWNVYSFPVSAGPLRLEWRYSKDASSSAGLDAAFIDALDLPLPSNTGDAPRISIIRLGTRPPFLQVFGPVRPYIIQGASALNPNGRPTEWFPVGTVFSDPNGNLVFTDPDFGTGPARFYRAVAP